ncbi:MAG: ABC transporter substrate-binding protein [Clostridia bacterium]|nr:ABC transporter substrate-binding protein [Clostridia bacterium]
MKKTAIKLAAILMALLMLIPFSLISCNKADEELEINIYALNGTTALGMAQMISNAKNGTDTMNYNITLYPSADVITSTIVSGECAIAALPTNVAAKLYKKSEGKIQLLALNTLGVLYLLDTTNTVDSLDDLKGKTVYLPGGGSNPEYITAALLKGAELTDVTLDTTSYASPDALQAAIVAGKVELAVLPEPKVSVVTSAKEGVSVALDLTEEWEKIYGKNTLVQGCLVVNKAFAEEHPTEIKKFLEDYKSSVDFIATGSDEAINMIVDSEILPKAAVAKKALPKCNICCITGEDMKSSINVFYEKLFDLDSTSIAAIPDDGFYYTAK